MDINVKLNKKQEAMLTKTVIKIYTNLLQGGTPIKEAASSAWKAGYELLRVPYLEILKQAPACGEINLVESLLELELDNFSRREKGEILEKCRGEKNSLLIYSCYFNRFSPNEKKTLGQKIAAEYWDAERKREESEKVTLGAEIDLPESVIGKKPLF